MNTQFNIPDEIRRCVYLTGALCAANHLYGKHATKKHLLRAAPENFFDWKGVNVYYKQIGTGDPVILVHAVHPAGSAFEWSRIADALAENHTVYMMDLPGCGRSGKPRLRYTSLYYMQFLYDFMEFLGLEHADIIASNRSAAFVLMLAAFKPELVGKMLLISPPAISRMAEAPDLGSKIKCTAVNLPILGTFIYNIISSRPQIDNYFSERYLYNPFHDSDALIDTYFESAHLGQNAGHYLAASYVGKNLNINVTHAVQTLKNPLKILIGEQTAGSKKTAEEWKTLRKNLECVLLPHTRQLPAFEEPESVIKEIVSFL